MTTEAKIRGLEVPVIDISALLSAAHTIAVVGVSPSPDRDSHRVARYLSEHGYRVIPVNPGLETLFGERCYPDLAAVPADTPIDIVDIFRRSEFIPEIVDQAIARQAGAVWMQLGLVDLAAARTARNAGLAVVMDLCIKVEHARWLGR